jgi:hypothetical protein
MRKCIQTRVSGFIAQLSLDPEESVVFGHTLRTAERPRFNLLRTDTNRKISDRRILCLS